MIVLDTNVLSEPLRVHPDANVLSWLSATVEKVAPTAVSVGEILVGVRSLPSGRRRDDLMAAIERTLANYADETLPYDERAARTYAELQESRRRAGRPLSTEDGMIAAICLDRGARLATRNVKDFEGLGIETIDPWAR